MQRNWNRIFLVWHIYWNTLFLSNKSSCLWEQNRLQCLPLTGKLTQEVDGEREYDDTPGVVLGEFLRVHISFNGLHISCSGQGLHNFSFGRHGLSHGRVGGCIAKNGLRVLLQKLSMVNCECWKLLNHCGWIGVSSINSISIASLGRLVGLSEDTVENVN